MKNGRTTIYKVPVSQIQYNHNNNPGLSIIKLLLDRQTSILFKPLLFLNLCHSNWACTITNTEFSTYVWVLLQCIHNTYAIVLICVLSNTSSANQIFFCKPLSYKNCEVVSIYLLNIFQYDSPPHQQLVIVLNRLYVLFYLISSRAHYEDIISSHFTD